MKALVIHEQSWPVEFPNLKSEGGGNSLSPADVTVKMKDEDGNGKRHSAGSDIPVFTREIDPIAWRSKIFRWAMAKRGGAHRSLNAPPVQDSFRQDDEIKGIGRFRIGD